MKKTIESHILSTICFMLVRQIFSLENSHILGPPSVNGTSLTALDYAIIYKG